MLYQKSGDDLNEKNGGVTHLQISELKSALMAITNFYLNKCKYHLGSETPSESLFGLYFLGEYYSNLKNTEQWDRIIHKKWENIVEDLERKGARRLSLYGGLSEVAYIAYILSAKTGNYTKLNKTLREEVCANIPHYLSILTRQRDFFSFSYYDCISGISGILRYTLLSTDSASIRASKALLQYLVDRALADEEENLSWLVKQENLPAGENYPHGVINFSMSHGLAGVLAIMAIALQSGVVVDGQKAAMDKIFEKYFLRYCCFENEIPFWPGMLSVDNIDSQNGVKGNRRMSWCYGSISILWALYLYGQSVSNTDLSTKAFASIEHIALLSSKDCLLVSPTICHGLAGLLSVLTVANAARGSTILKGRMVELCGEITGLFDPSFDYGFQNINYIPDKGTIVAKTSSTNSFLEGATGVLLVLLAASGVLANSSFEQHLLLK